MEMIKMYCPVSEAQRMYREKLTTADEAVKCIRSGDHIHYGLFSGLVDSLDIALAKRTEELHDVLVWTTNWNHPRNPAILDADPNAEHFKYISTHMSTIDRRNCKEGRAWFLPVQFRENTKYWEECVGNIDVAMLQVGPMDRFGNFNLGPQVAEYWGIFKSATKIIVEVNEKFPKVQGSCTELNIAQVDMVVEGPSNDLPNLAVKEASETEKRIANHIVNLMESGSTIQLGIGGIPNTVGKLIADSDINDLSCHTEMFVDAYMELFNAGKITGNKNTNKGKMVFTFAMGSSALYDFINDNPYCYAAPCEYVNAIEVIASNDKVVSINSCMQVDLFGQANSESSGLRHISGNGGQMDYVQAAFKSKGGKSFLCTPSVRKNKDGSLTSLIMPTLPEGTIVTCPRHVTDYVVTEYGAVRLKGKSTWERAEALISIAHPDFRDELFREAEKMGIWKTSSKVSV